MTASTRDDLLAASDDAGELTGLLARVVRSDMTAEQAAKACLEVLKQVATAAGQDGDYETMIRAPGEPRHYDEKGCWCVAWEAGPYDWAVPASMALTRAAGKLVEPYYGFDLMFFPSEWEGQR